MDGDTPSSAHERARCCRWLPGPVRTLTARPASSGTEWAVQELAVEGQRTPVVCARKDGAVGHPRWGGRCDRTGQAHDNGSIRQSVRQATILCGDRDQYLWSKHGTVTVSTVFAMQTPWHDIGGEHGHCRVRHRHGARFPRAATPTETRKELPAARQSQRYLRPQINEADIVPPRPNTRILSYNVGIPINSLKIQ
jgi:hypothetical protein